MSNRAPTNQFRALLAALTAAVAAAGCLDKASKHNDDTTSVAGTSGKGGAGGSRAGKGGSTAGTGGEDGGGAGDTADASVITGSGMDCQSYTPQMDGKCAGWYCGVDLETLSMAIDPDAKCGGDVETLCRNLVITAVGKCARMIKAANLDKTNDALRPLIRTCVYGEPDLDMTKVPVDCLDCTIDGAECTAQYCLGECLAGDSARCDTCRIDNNCEQPTFSCGEIPSPL